MHAELKGRIAAGEDVPLLDKEELKTLENIDQEFQEMLEARRQLQKEKEELEKAIEAAEAYDGPVDFAEV